MNVNDSAGCRSSQHGPDIHRPAGPTRSVSPQVSARTISNDGSIHVGVRECTPGGWSIVDRGDTDAASTVSAKGVVTGADGVEHVPVPGPVLTLPKGWPGRWDITESLRKVYGIVV